MGESEGCLLCTVIRGGSYQRMARNATHERQHPSVTASPLNRCLHRTCWVVCRALETCGALSLHLPLNMGGAGGAGGKRPKIGLPSSPPFQHTINTGGVDVAERGGAVRACVRVSEAIMLLQRALFGRYPKQKTPLPNRFELLGRSPHP